MRDILKDDGLAGLDVIQGAVPDILLLTDIDYDAGLVALGALADRLAQSGLDYPYRFAARPNTGLQTGLDLDADGRTGGARDAQGYGWFSGQGGQAVLSRWPVSLTASFSEMLWRDAPDSAMLSSDTGQGVQRLSTSAHWQLTVAHPEGDLTLLTVAATPPVFDGPEDRNGRRNRDEVLLWTHVLNGNLGAPIRGDVVLLGNLNLDPDRGDGLRAAMGRLLSHPRLQDPLPGHPTVEWSGPGEMRVSYVLPSAELTVLDAGITQPSPDAGPHRLVWVDLDLTR